MLILNAIFTDPGAVIVLKTLLSQLCFIKHLFIVVVVHIRVNGFALGEMMHVPGSGTLRTPKEDISHIVDCVGIDNRDRVLATIFLTLHLLLTCGKTVPQRLCHGTVLPTALTNSLVRRRTFLDMRETDATSALEDEKIFADFGN
jgi:hypothetical protein